MEAVPGSRVGLSPILKTAVSVSVSTWTLALFIFIIYKLPTGKPQGKLPFETPRPGLKEKLIVSLKKEHARVSNGFN